MSEPSKVCTKCGRGYPLSGFNRNPGSKRDGRRSDCRSCSRAAILKYYGERTPEWQAATLRRTILRRYGLTPATFEAMLEAQGGRCALCLTDDPGGQYGTFSVDHDHSCCPGRGSCGKCIRGLLCDGCNRYLAGPRETPEFADRLRIYVTRRKEVKP